MWDRLGGNEGMDGAFARQDVMTINGTVTKTAILLAILVATAIVPWTLFYAALNQSGMDAAIAAMHPWYIAGIVGGLVTWLVVLFKPRSAPIAGPIYAAFEGLFVGGISAVLNAFFEGIAIQAIALTLGVLAVMLIAYSTGIIKVTEKFKAGVIGATGAIFIIYVISFVGSLFGMPIPYIHEAGLIGIGFSLFCVTIASLFLALDFAWIEEGAEQGAPKWMEWYLAWGLMVTLIWLYIEILKLLVKLRMFMED